MQTIRLMIVDDQPILVEGLSMILGGLDGIEVAVTAGDGQEAVERMCDAVDLVLMDIRMPRMDGLEATERIRRDHPDVKVILLTTFRDEAYIRRGFSLGVDGYALKEADPTELHRGILAVMGGGAYIHEEIARQVIKGYGAASAPTEADDPRVQRLSARELDIVRAIAGGRNNEEIAARLYLSVGTVKNHVSRILEKLELRDRTQIAVFAFRSGLVES